MLCLLWLASFGQMMAVGFIQVVHISSSFLFVAKSRAVV